MGVPVVAVATAGTSLGAGGADTGRPALFPDGASIALAGSSVESPVCLLA